MSFYGKLTITPPTKITLNGVNYRRSEDSLVFIYEDNTLITNNIQKAYSNYKDQKPTCPLYEKLLEATHNTRPELSLAEEISIAAKYHSAQMTNNFGLGKSQRQAIHYYFSCGKGELLAINGPPGTGKTTLLQTAIASEWVNAIINSSTDQTTPPLILATSSNNQAVTNIIKDFGKILAEDTQNPLEKRWLPQQIKSLGAYYVSPSRGDIARITKEHLSLSSHWNKEKRKFELKGFFSSIETREFLHSALQLFLGNYKKYSKESFNDNSTLSQLKAIRCHLRSLINRNIKMMSDSLLHWGRLYQAINKIPQLDIDITTNKQKISSLNEEVHDLLPKVAEVSTLKQNRIYLYQKAANADSSEPIWFSLFGFLPIIKTKRKNYVQAFLLGQNFSLEKNPDTIQELCVFFKKDLNDLDQKLDNLTRQEKVIKEKIKHLEENTISKKKERSNLNTLIRENENSFPWLNHPEPFSKSALHNLLEHFDKTTRYENFLLAIHYYEALWLEKTYVSHQAEYEQELSTLDRLHRISMLTPCIVSTLFMAPKLLTSNRSTLFNSLDLLILDEAGQASVEKASAAFSLSQKALVVGDIHQIEPVVTIPDYIDLATREKYDLQETTDLLSAISGNAMKLAQEVTPYKLSSQKERGMHLLEHRRCHSTIINYSKELIYPKLSILTAQRSEASYLYPHMGYANIPSQSKRINASRSNEYEAANIANWLHENSETILSHYKTRKLDDVVGIITPFKLQIPTLRNELRNHLPQHNWYKNIGTIHTFQGAEKPIIIFSPTYGENDNQLNFIDQKVNMLNVAVSRATDAFLVFGNMQLFDPNLETPSGILAKHLKLDSDKNELKNFQLIPRPFMKNIKRLKTLSDHQQALDWCFNNAQRELIIVSPFITKNAIMADDIITKIQRATSRGVCVTIYANRRFTLNITGHNENELRLLEQIITQAKANLVWAKRIHSKTIKVDDHTVIEGSFNWLSANRTGSGNLEQSIMYQGEEVKKWTRDIEQSLQQYS